MKSNKYKDIIQSIEDCIKKGKQDSLLNRMQFDYEIRNVQEFSNYLVILLTLMEEGNYEISNNIFLRKIINAPERYSSFLSGFNDTFEIIKCNAVFPFFGISNTIGSLIMDLIDDSENIKEFKDKIPEKEFLVQFNFDFLKRYFDEINSKIVYRHFMRLFYNCFDNVDKHSRVLHSLPEVSLYFKEKLIASEDFLDNYLGHFLRRGGMKYSVPGYGSFFVEPEPQFENIFGSIIEFEKIVSTSNSKVKKDILEFIFKYQSNKKVLLEDLSLDKNQHELLKNEK